MNERTNEPPHRVELVGGPHDGAVLHLQPGTLPVDLGVVVSSAGHLHPVRSATTRKLISDGAIPRGTLYRLRLGTPGHARYDLARTAPAEGQS